MAPCHPDFLGAHDCWRVYLLPMGHVCLGKVTVGCSFHPYLPPPFHPTQQPLRSRLAINVHFFLFVFVHPSQLPWCLLRSACWLSLLRHGAIWRSGLGYEAGTSSTWLSPVAVASGPTVVSMVTQPVTAGQGG